MHRIIDEKNVEFQEWMDLSDDDNNERSTSLRRKRTKFTDDKTEAEKRRIREKFHEARGLELKYQQFRKVLDEMIRQIDIDNDTNYVRREFIDCSDGSDSSGGEVHEVFDENKRPLCKPDKGSPNSNKENDQVS